MSDDASIELLNLVIDILSDIENEAAMFPNENSPSISVSDFLSVLLAKAPAHLQPAVHSATERFVEVAPRRVFVPHWLRVRHS